MERFRGAYAALESAVWRLSPTPLQRLVSVAEDRRRLFVTYVLATALVVLRWICGRGRLINLMLREPSAPYTSTNRSPLTPYPSQHPLDNQWVMLDSGVPAYLQNDEPGGVQPQQTLRLVVSILSSILPLILPLLLHCLFQPRRMQH